MFNKNGLKGTNAYLFSVYLPKTCATVNNIPGQYLSRINHFFLSIVGSILIEIFDTIIHC